MSDLAAFLLARIAEDEERARKRMIRAQQNHLLVRAPENLGRVMPGWWEWPEIEADAARVLAECDAKRQVVELFNQIGSRSTNTMLDGGAAAMAILDGLEMALRALVLPYAKHPDFREEWKL